MSVLIRGEGVAGLCCGHLLRRCGIAVHVERTGRPRLPAVVVGQAAQKLISDTFGREDLFAGQPRIEKRIVKWGQNAKPVELSHFAVVISEDVLLERIALGESGISSEPDWTVFAGKPSPPDA